MSTITRRAFGKFFREIRENAGKSLLAAGLAVETSKHTIARLEDGIPTRMITAQIEQLLDLYEVAPPVRAEALELWSEVREQAKAAKLQGSSKGFWQAYSDQFAAHFPHYLRLEAAANRVATHQLVLVHGLLQTADYRRTLARIDYPNLSNVDVERRVELTQRRQDRLSSKGFRFDAFISEAALRHPVGGPAIMEGQLRRLVELSACQSVGIRVVPFGPSHRGLTIGSFTLLEFPLLASELREPPVVYLEGAFGALYHEQQEIIAQYREAIEALRAVALTEEDTRELVSRVAKEYAA